MKKTFRLKENDLNHIVKKVIKESKSDDNNLKNNIEIYKLYKKGEVSKRNFDLFLSVLSRKEKEDLKNYIDNNK
jgi:20S proteasome alpha/beta subunit